MVLMSVHTEDVTYPVSSLSCSYDMTPGESVTGGGVGGIKDYKPDYEFPRSMMAYSVANAYHQSRRQGDGTAMANGNGRDVSSGGSGGGVTGQYSLEMSDTDDAIPENMLFSASMFSRSHSHDSLTVLSQQQQNPVGVAQESFTGRPVSNASQSRTSNTASRARNAPDPMSIRHLELSSSDSTVTNSTEMEHKKSVLTVDRAPSGKNAVPPAATATNISTSAPASQETAAKPTSNPKAKLPKSDSIVANGVKRFSIPRSDYSQDSSGPEEKSVSSVNSDFFVSSGGGGGGGIKSHHREEPIEHISGSHSSIEDRSSQSQFVEGSTAANPTSRTFASPARHDQSQQPLSQPMTPVASAVTSTISSPSDDAIPKDKNASSLIRAKLVKDRIMNISKKIQESKLQSPPPPTSSPSGSTSSNTDGISASTQNGVKPIVRKSSFFRQNRFVEQDIKWRAERPNDRESDDITTLGQQTAATNNDLSAREPVKKYHMESLHSLDAPPSVPVVHRAQQSMPVSQPVLVSVSMATNPVPVSMPIDNNSSVKPIPPSSSASATTSTRSRPVYVPPATTTIEQHVTSPSMDVKYKEYVPDDMISKPPVMSTTNANGSVAFSAELRSQPTPQTQSQVAMPSVSTFSRPPIVPPISLQNINIGAFPVTAQGSGGSGAGGSQVSTARSLPRSVSSSSDQGRQRSVSSSTTTATPANAAVSRSHSNHSADVAQTKSLRIDTPAAGSSSAAAVTGIANGCQHDDDQYGLQPHASTYSLVSHNATISRSGSCSPLSRAQSMLLVEKPVTVASSWKDAFGTTSMESRDGDEDEDKEVSDDDDQMFRVVYRLQWQPNHLLIPLPPSPKRHHSFFNNSHSPNHHNQQHHHHKHYRRTDSQDGINSHSNNNNSMFQVGTENVSLFFRNAVKWSKNAVTTQRKNDSADSEGIDSIGEENVSAKIQSPDRSHNSNNDSTGNSSQCDVSSDNVVDRSGDEEKVDVRASASANAVNTVFDKIQQSLLSTVETASNTPNQWSSPQWMRSLPGDESADNNNDNSRLVWIVLPEVESVTIKLSPNEFVDKHVWRARRMIRRVSKRCMSLSTHVQSIVSNRLSQRQPSVPSQSSAQAADPLTHPVKDTSNTVTETETPSPEQRDDERPQSQSSTSHNSHKPNKHHRKKFSFRQTDSLVVTDDPTTTTAGLHRLRFPSIVATVTVQRNTKRDGNLLSVDETTEALTSSCSAMDSIRFEWLVDQWDNTLDADRHVHCRYDETTHLLMIHLL